MVVQNRWLRHGFISAGALLFILICLSCLPARAAEKAAAPAQVTWNIPHLTQPPRIDGDLREWANIVPVFLGVEKDQIRYYSLRPWAGPLDSSAKIWMGWDKNNLYFAADIRDDVFYQTSSTDLAAIWSEDSLWLTVASPDKTKQNGTVVLLSEINWAIVTSGRAAIVTKRGAEDYKAGAFPVAAHKKSDGTGWICEGAIPWSEISLSARPGALMRLSWVIADSDTDSKVLSVPLSDIDANIEPKDLYTNDLIALVWPRAAGNYYKPWNFALAKLSDAPPPADSKIARQAASRTYQGLLARNRAAKDMKSAQALLWTGHANAFLGGGSLARQVYQDLISKYPNDTCAGVALRAVGHDIRSMKGMDAEKAYYESMIEEHKESYTLGLNVGMELIRGFLRNNKNSANIANFSQTIEEMIEPSQGGMAGAGVLMALFQPMLSKDMFGFDFWPVMEQLSSLVQSKYPGTPFAKLIKSNYVLERAERLYQNRSYLLAGQELEAGLKQGLWEGEQDLEAMHLTGLCYQATDQTEMALYWLNEAQKTNRQSARRLGTRYQIAVCYYRAGNFSAARENFQKVINEDPGGQLAGFAKERIAQCEDMLETQKKNRKQ